MQDDLKEMCHSDVKEMCQSSNSTHMIKKHDVMLPHSCLFSCAQNETLAADSCASKGFFLMFSQAYLLLPSHFFFPADYLCGNFFFILIFCLCCSVFSVTLTKTSSSLLSMWTLSWKLPPTLNKQNTLWNSYYCCWHAKKRKRKEERRKKHRRWEQLWQMVWLLQTRVDHWHETSFLQSDHYLKHTCAPIAEGEAASR